jgi:AraC-like DNA-binding protein
MDPLSDVIALLRPQDCIAAGLDAGGDWSISFNRHAGLKCNAVLKGSCWLSVHGEAHAIHLRAGDCVILPKGLPFILSASNARIGMEAEDIYGPVPHGGTAVYGGGGDFFMTGSRFLLSGPIAAVLLRSLPTAIVIRQDPQQDAVRWALDRIAEELRDPRLGGALSIAHLSHFVFVQAVRNYLDAACQVGGWLGAIADSRLSRAVAAMHGDVARFWTVADLASEAGMSRTAFAVRFRQITGQSPMGYLTQYRMLIAAERLRTRDAPTVQIAEDVGYSSESAFVTAFTRTMGVPPRRFARDAEATAKQRE